MVFCCNGESSIGVACTPGEGSDTASDSFDGVKARISSGSVLPSADNLFSRCWDSQSCELVPGCDVGPKMGFACTPGEGSDTASDSPDGVKARISSGSVLSSDDSLFSRCFGQLKLHDMLRERSLHICFGGALGLNLDCDHFRDWQGQIP